MTACLTADRPGCPSGSLGRARAMPVRAARGWGSWTLWCLARLLLAVWLVVAGPVSAAQATEAVPLVLDDHQPVREAWSSVRILEGAPAEHDGRALLARLGSFRVPEVPSANLGVRREAVWLHLPLLVSLSSDGRWLLDIDYPSLDRIDVFVFEGDRLLREAVLGDSLLFRERPVAARSHQLDLQLPVGRRLDVLMRVETTSSMILPIRLQRQSAANQTEAGVQLLQGVAVGIGLCLLAYALAYWISLRDPSFVYYALSVLGITLFFVAYHGLGPQYLWGSDGWLTANMAPFAVLWALVGGLLFLERALYVSEWSPRLARAMQAAALVAGVTALLFALGLINYRTAHLISTVLGPTPILLGIPAAYRRARRGDRAAIYVLVGWGIYAVGIFTMAALLRGLVGVNLWSQHAFQAGALLEMIMWMRVLGVRIEETRKLADQAQVEREAMRSLAQTDPLTGLANRRGLEAALEAALARGDGGGTVALFLLDLDGFKAVNDQLGHAAGDALLAGVAQRLRACVRGSDVVARLGGDEFVVLAPQLAGDAAAQVVGRKLLDTVVAPFAVGEGLCRVGMTVGYALAPEDARDAVELIRRADAAMYAGKQAGKGCVRRDQNTGMEPVAAPQF